MEMDLRRVSTGKGVGKLTYLRMINGRDDCIPVLVNRRELAELIKGGTVEVVEDDAEDVGGQGRGRSDERQGAVERCELLLRERCDEVMQSVHRGQTQTALWILTAMSSSAWPPALKYVPALRSSALPYADER